MSSKGEAQKAENNNGTDAPGTEMVPMGGAKDAKSINSVFDTEQETVDIWKQKISNFLDHTWSQAIMMIVTVWSLFGDDIRLIHTDTDADTTFAALTWVCLILFGAELILSSLGKKRLLPRVLFLA